MNEGSLGMIVEVLVCLLLLATIFYCISVNRKLERLRNEQKGMHGFIRELVGATENADNAIKALREAVGEAGSELAGQIDRGRNMSRQLKTEIQSADQTMNKLVVLTGSARKVAGGQPVQAAAVQAPPPAAVSAPPPAPMQVERVGPVESVGQVVAKAASLSDQTARSVEELRRSMIGFEDLETSAAPAGAVARAAISGAA